MAESAAEQGVVSAARGTGVALGFPLAALVLWLTVPVDPLRIELPLLGFLILAAALAERYTVAVSTRVRMAASAEIVILAALLGGPLAGALVGFGSICGSDGVWRRRAAEAGVASLQGFCIGLLGPLPTTATAPQLVVVLAAAVTLFVLLNLSAGLLVALERQIRPLWPHLQMTAKLEVLSAGVAFPFMLLLLVAAAESALLLAMGLAGLMAVLALARGTHLKYKRRLSAERALARRDASTGIANVRAFDEELAVAHARVLRGERPVGLYILDLDYFKRVNSEHGHAAGSALLRGLAERLTQALRRSDFVARYGGEEFVILAPAMDGRAELTRFAERLRLLVCAEPFRIGHVQVAVTVSVGGALLDGTRTPAEVFEAADAALARAKATRNTAAVEEREPQRLPGFAQASPA